MRPCECALHRVTMLPRPRPLLSQRHIGEMQIAKLTSLLSKASEKANEGLLASAAGFLWGK